MIPITNAAHGSTTAQPAVIETSAPSSELHPYANARVFVCEKAYSCSSERKVNVDDLNAYLAEVEVSQSNAREDRAEDEPRARSDGCVDRDLAGQVRASIHTESRS